MITDAAWVTWGVPFVAALFAGTSFLVLWLSSRNFDRRYGRGPK